MAPAAAKACLKNLTCAISFSAISVAIATAFAEKASEVLATPPEEVAVRLLLVPAAQRQDDQTFRSYCEAWL